MKRRKICTILSLALVLGLLGACTKTPTETTVSDSSSETTVAVEETSEESEETTEVPSVEIPEFETEALNDLAESYANSNYVFIDFVEELVGSDFGVIEGFTATGETSDGDFSTVSFIQFDTYEHAELYLNQYLADYGEDLFTVTGEDETIYSYDNDIESFVIALDNDGLMRIETIYIVEESPIDVNGEIVESEDVEEIDAVIVDVEE